MNAKQWYFAVFDRDKCCQVCGGYPVEAHHILTKGSRPDLKRDVDNGILLCQKCHRRAHDKPERFKKWLLENKPDQAEYLNIVLKPDFEGLKNK